MDFGDELEVRSVELAGGDVVGCIVIVRTDVDHNNVGG